MKCPKCDGESLSKVNPLVDYGAGAAAGAAVGTVVPVVGTVIGAAIGACVAGLRKNHPTMQVYHKCNSCGATF